MLEENHFRVFLLSCVKDDSHSFCKLAWKVLCPLWHNCLGMLPFLSVDECKKVPAGGVRVDTEENVCKVHLCEVFCSQRHPQQVPGSLLHQKSAPKRKVPTKVKGHQKILSSGG